ncbi:MAG: lamin tail domain-containing protein, partial [Nocardioidaceae bacterium]
MRITPLGALVALVVVGAAAAAGGAALALAQSSSAEEAVIHACRHPNGGWVRIVPAGTACRPREQAVSWNVRGPAGEQGAAGSPGPKGDPGAGLTKLDDLDGIPCTPDGGGSGRVEFDLAGDDTVLLRCVTAEGPPPPGNAKLVINEVDYDQVGADGDGFVEIKNAGDAAADLGSIALVFVDGADSTEYRREQLTGTLEPGGYLVVAADAQNGAPDGLALLETSAGTLLDALSYEGAITGAQIGSATFSLVEGTALPATMADSNTVDGSLIRAPDGRDTDDASSDWAFTTTLTRGAANVLTPAPLASPVGGL